MKFSFSRIHWQIRSILLTPILTVLFFANIDALADRTGVIAWGWSQDVWEKMPSNLTNVTQVEASLWHGMALRTDGTIEVWEANNLVDLSPPEAFEDIVGIGTGYHTCLVIRGDGTVTQWGSWSRVPSGLSDVVAVDGGISHSVALKADGSVVAWGSEDQVSNPLPATVVPPEATNIVKVVAGTRYNLALRADGVAIGWGDSNYGQADVPPGLTDVIDIAASTHNSIALRRDGTVVVWGWDRHGLFDIPHGLNDVVDVEAGTDFYLVLTRDGSIVTWGQNAGDYSNVPAQPGDILSVSTASHHSYAITRFAAPNILSFPEHRWVEPGGEIELSALVAGSDLTYSWIKDGETMDGHTDTTLLITNFQPDDVGEYQLEVSNELGTDLSGRSAVNLYTPFITPENWNDVAQLVNGLFFMPIRMPEPERDVVIEASHNLTHWWSVSTNRLSPGEYFFLSPQLLVRTNQFFRVRFESD